MPVKKLNKLARFARYRCRTCDATFLVRSKEQGFGSSQEWAFECHGRIGRIRLPRVSVVRSVLRVLGFRRADQEK